MEKIFVNITSYRDPQCQWTVKDLFEKATHPERIFVGICWQFDEAEDKQCFTQPAPYPKQVRTLNFHPRESKGSGWAHAQAQSLHEGEEYTLQIHAHTRFDQGWDSALIDMLKRCPSSKPALSTALPGYIPPETFPYRDEAKEAFLIVDKVSLNEPQLVHLGGGLYNTHTGVMRRTPFWYPHFLFARSELLKEVPYDPHIFFFGEGISFSVRAWTHGWDIFQPDRLVLFHWWGSSPEIARPWRSLADARHKHTFMRVKHLLRLKAAPESAALIELEKYGLGQARALDDFWGFAGIDLPSGRITEYASRGLWNKPYAHLLSRAGEPTARKPRIFVQIASYRDPECQWTVKDLFEKAKFPERITVGICWQCDPEEDKHCFEVSVRPEQVRITRVHWKESLGVCWARRQTQLLWEGEEYTLAIDSHMRFEFDWDERLIYQIAQCPSPKAILTYYPNSYVPPHELEIATVPPIMRAYSYTPEGHLTLKGYAPARAPERPLRGAFIAAGFMFSKADVIREVPYDPYLYFNQEEQSMAVRFYTHGWDVYTPTEVLIYHYYKVTNKSNAPLHWSDNTFWEKLSGRARKRLDHLLGRKLSDDPEVIQDIFKYDLGDARSLAEYAAYCGIDFIGCVLSEKGMRAGFIEGLDKYLDGPVYVEELDAPKASDAPAATPDAKLT